MVKIKCKAIVISKKILEARQIEEKRIKDVESSFTKELTTFDENIKNRKNLLKIADSETCKKGNAKVEISCSESDTAKRDLQNLKRSSGPRFTKLQQGALDDFDFIAESFDCQRELGKLNG